MARLVLRPQREARIRGGHPWIYRADVARLDGAWQDGEAVTVAAADGRLLGRGFYNPRPQIVCRLVTRRDEAVDDAFFRRRLEAAAAFRETLGYDGDAVAPRLRRGRSPPGPDPRPLRRRPGPPGADPGHGGPRRPAGRARPPRSRARAPSTGAATPRRRPSRDSTTRAAGSSGRGETEIEIREGPCRFRLDLEGGQKTGFYLDQRENRAEVGRAGRRVGRCWTPSRTPGAFAAWALRGGAASVLALDSSGAACARAAAHLDANAPAGRHAAPRGARGQRLRRAPRFERDGAPLRPDRARPAAVHPAAGDARRGAPRLQGDQPARAALPRARRAPRDLLLLPSREPGALRGRLPSGGRGRRTRRCGSPRA